MIDNRLTDLQINDLYKVAAEGATEPYDSSKLRSIAISNLIIIELLIRLNEKTDIQKKNLIDIIHG